MALRYWVRHVIARPTAPRPGDVAIPPRTILVYTLVSAPLLGWMRFWQPRIPCLQVHLYGAVVPALQGTKLEILLPDFPRPRLFLAPTNTQLLQAGHGFCVNQHVFMSHGNQLRVVFPTLFPDYAGDEVLLAEYFSARVLQVLDFVVVDGYEDYAIFP